MDGRPRGVTSRVGERVSSLRAGRAGVAWRRRMKDIPMTYLLVWAAIFIALVAGFFCSFFTVIPDLRDRLAMKVYLVGLTVALVGLAWGAWYWTTGHANTGELISLVGLGIAVVLAALCAVAQLGVRLGSR